MYPYIFLASLILFISFGIYSLIWSKIDDTNKEKVMRHQRTVGFMFGIFYNLEDGRDLFVVKTWSEKDATHSIEKISENSNSHSSILNHTDFEKQTGRSFDGSKMHIKKVPIDRIIYPYYKNSGIEWDRP